MGIPVQVTRRLRIAVGAFVCFALPVASRAGGSGALAWTMYSRADSFRIELVTFDGAGHSRLANPSALAEHAAPGVVSLLGGSDHWRSGSSAVLRAHGDALAERACDVLGVARVELTIRDRVEGQRDSDRSTTFRRRCTP